MLSLFFSRGGDITGMLLTYFISYTCVWLAVVSPLSISDKQIHVKYKEKQLAL